MKRIKWVTQVIALPYEVQKSLFPDFVNVADELAIEWEIALDELSVSKVISSITEEQKLSFKILDDYMLSISGALNTEYWSDRALKESVEWQKMQVMANNILIIMHSIDLKSI